MLYPLRTPNKTNTRQTRQTNEQTKKQRLGTFVLGMLKNIAKAPRTRKERTAIISFFDFVPNGNETLLDRWIEKWGEAPVMIDKKLIPNSGLVAKVIDEVLTPRIIYSKKVDEHHFDIVHINIKMGRKIVRYKNYIKIFKIKG